MLPAGSVPDLRMGVGVYGPLPRRALGDTTVATYLEHDGHTWGFSSGVSGSTVTSGRRLSTSAASVDRVGQVVFHTNGFARVEFRAGSSRESGSFSGGGEGTMGGLWAPAFSDAHVRLAQGTGRFGMALYERLD